ncbi:UNVERIFIED_CONTAM: DNA-binding protein [Pseudomonas aeruginosa]|uniref:DNA-binding protein n=1 Tax=Pseudomonas aeruginosa TaxID=287 RepID=UPI0021176BB6|nr:DNA-binding protein [Pseudomonas aeruginosa]
MTSEHLSSFDSVRRNVPEDCAIGEVLELSDWFCHAVDFDPKSGQALPQSLSVFLARIAGYSPPEAGSPFRDRLWRITEHCRAAVDRLVRGLNEAPRREQALLPAHAVRELDATSFIKLSNRPGRNLREKLAGNPCLQGVRRFQSVDLPENRLFKACMVRLVQHLELRSDSHVQQDDLLLTILSWLRSGEARDIGRWENLPPNNTLLSHRDYRRVWDAWRWLQTLEDDTARDLSEVHTRRQTRHRWSTYSRIWSEGHHCLADMPVFFDFDTFEIRPWFNSVAMQSAPERIKRDTRIEIRTPVCVDLATSLPRYAAGRTARHLPGSFLWQQWQGESTEVALDLFTSDAIYRHPQVTTLFPVDLFFSKAAPEHLDRAARAFTSRLHEVFRNDTLIWLVPDALSDFELDVTRRNLNARFQDAVPLPRSIAAAVQRVDYSKVNAGFPIVVIDNVGGKTCVTKLVARFDPALKDKLPETRGFYWERHPPVIISSTPAHESEPSYAISSIDDQARWHPPAIAAKPPALDTSMLKQDSRIGGFAFSINVSESPVSGGLHFHALQQRAGEIPLWRDQIPELSIKVLKDGRHQRFQLVSRGTTVTPIRGRPVSIDVKEDFTLPAEKPFYQFPLFLGDNSEDLGYSARLDSSAFPLKESVDCMLHLTFEYGADDPYQLTFIPRNGAFAPIRATWRRTKEQVITDAPGPEYPAPMTWADLRHVPKPGSSETTDLLDWITRAITRLDQSIYIRPRVRAKAVISREWRPDKHGGYITFATTSPTQESVFIHEKNILSGYVYTDFSVGDSISFERHEQDGKSYGRRIAGEHHEEVERLKRFDETTSKNLVTQIRKALYYPVIQIWRDGRSIDDADCPGAFAEAAHTHIDYLVSLLDEDDLPAAVKNTILVLMCCMHKDVPSTVVQRLAKEIEKGSIRNPQAIGFALGRLDEPWQRALFSGLMRNITKSVLRTFACAIWRDRHFVEQFDSAQMTMVLTSLNLALGQIKPCPETKGANDDRAAVNWMRATTELLELLLGVLRTREAADMQLRMLLQPHQQITKALARSVERVSDLIAQSTVVLSCRVQINIEKPDGDHTPDLLFALRLYLTGDDGANSIHISRIFDSQDE